MKNSNQNTVFYIFSIFLICLLGLLSCTATHSGLKSDSYEENKNIAPEIIFLTYSIKLNRSNGEPEIKLINKGIAGGKLKINSSWWEIPKPGDLMCVAVDNRMGPLDSIIISDPLNITVESVDENNAFFKKEIALDSSQFSIRMQLTKKTDAIAVRKRTNSKNQNVYMLITKIK